MAERESSIRAVERAITLLRALNQMPVSTLDGLHQLTSLPNPTLLRLLRTFEGFHPSSSETLIRHSSPRRLRPRRH
jgi:hypothetical protein